MEINDNNFPQFISTTLNPQEQAKNNEPQMQNKQIFTTQDSNIQYQQFFMKSGGGQMEKTQKVYFLNGFLASNDTTKEKQQNPISEILQYINFKDSEFEDIRWNSTDLNDLIQNSFFSQILKQLQEKPLDTFLVNFIVDFVCEFKLAYNLAEKESETIASKIAYQIEKDDKLIKQDKRIVLIGYSLGTLVLLKILQKLQNIELKQYKVTQIITILGTAKQKDFELVLENKKFECIRESCINFYSDQDIIVKLFEKLAQFPNILQMLEQSIGTTQIFGIQNKQVGKNILVHFYTDETAQIVNQFLNSLNQQPNENPQNSNDKGQQNSPNNWIFPIIVIVFIVCKQVFSYYIKKKIL